MKSKISTLITFFVLSFLNVNAQNPPQNAPVMTINVTNGAQITISLLATTSNTDVWIETASGIYSHMILGFDWAANLTYTASEDFIRIYGNIESLECKNNGNKVVGLDASQNPHLRILWCNENNISTLKVNPDIVSIFAMGNALSELDITTCSSLSLLYCERNKLQELDVHYNPLLEHLSFSQNNISRIDVSNNSDLYAIAMFGNTFDACALDTLFYDIANRSGDFSGTIYIQNAEFSNPGLSGSKTDAAVAKNWEVQDYNQGNPYNVSSNGNGCNNVFVSELQPEITFTAQPNPAKDWVKICTQNLKNSEKLVIYDMTGKVMLEQQITAVETNISLGHLPQGIYFIRVGSASKKIVKE